ncbi:MAG: hypothetical protein ACKVY0_30125 [Prosthecobacter sp.]|uniref:hypothetical protein n=1 Tax=Prosthecobacter sp. TaxID=1965333 RepID=UPI0038FEC528
MGVCFTLCVCLVLTLFVGWKWYFESVASRNTLIDLAEKADSRVRELENLGLSIDAAKTEVTPAPALPKISVDEAVLQPSASVQDARHPAESKIKELPLAETGDDVVQALALLDQYWKHAAWKDRIPLVADSSRVAALMQDFYETQGAVDPVPGGMISKARYQINGTEILYFSYTSSRPTGTLEVALLRGPDGKFLLDWESLTGYGEMSFQDFRTKRPTKPVSLRAYVRLFEYYNFEFSDSKRYLCMKLTSESGESSVYAYCERGTELARWLETDLASTGPTGFKGYLLQLSFPPNAQSNQCVNLDKVVTARWLTLP